MFEHKSNDDYKGWKTNIVVSPVGERTNKAVTLPKY